MELAVSDSGTGIPREHLERLYEPFFTTKAKGKGTGLGLAMVYGFVNRSGGYIKVYSELGIGTTFKIYLPRTSEQATSAETRTRTITELPTGSETLLVVDDEEQLLELTRVKLEKLGYRVFTARNSDQALSVLAEQPSIDLLFSDVVMPGGVNGFQLAERAVADKPNLKVLLTSGYTERAIAHNGQAKFAKHLLSKPYTIEKLAREVRIAIEGLG